MRTAQVVKVALLQALLDSQNDPSHVVFQPAGGVRAPAAKRRPRGRDHNLREPPHFQSRVGSDEAHSLQALVRFARRAAVRYLAQGLKNSTSSTRMLAPPGEVERNPNVQVPLVTLIPVMLIWVQVEVTGMVAILAVPPKPLASICAAV